jgi:hypothetical protein
MRSVGDSGDSHEQARQRGSMFDNMSFTWNLPACSNAELIEDYRQQYDFQYYEDRGVTVEVQYEIVALGELYLHS